MASAATLSNVPKTFHLGFPREPWGFQGKIVLSQDSILFYVKFFEKNIGSIMTCRPTGASNTKLGPSTLRRVRAKQASNL